MLNKKGHIPTFLLIPATIILVGIISFYFLSSSEDIKLEKEGYNGLISEIEFREQFTSEKLELIIKEALDRGDIDGFETEIKKIASKERGGGIDYVGNLYGQIVNDKYELIRNGDIFTLKIEDVFVKVESENSEIKRTFNLEVRFDEDGIIE